MLHDLITQDWPRTASLDNTQFPIVYYVGYYLPSAVIGKAFGWITANIFIFFWTLIGIMLAFAWFWNTSRIESNNRAMKIGVLLTEIFCLAGGLDYFGYYPVNKNAFNHGAHIETWANYFQYSSNTTLVYWVPQHTIAVWLLIGMIVDALYDKQNLKYLGMATTAGLIWSSFGIVGTIPYLLLVLFIYIKPRYRRYLFNSESIVFNSLAIEIVTIYVLSRINCSAQAGIWHNPYPIRSIPGEHESAGSITFIQDGYK